MIYPSLDAKSRSVSSRDKFLIVYDHEGRTVCLEGWPDRNKAQEQALWMNDHEGKQRYRVEPRPDYFKTTGD